MNETNKNSLGFSSFRAWMDLWDDYVFSEAAANDIEKILNTKQLLFFFKIKNENKMFGADENARLAFARMKNPDDDLTDTNGSFQAYDLKILFENLKKTDDLQTIKIFNKKDLNKIKVIDQSEVVDELSKIISNKNMLTTIEKEPNRNILTDKDHE